jgi:transmembrane sensor
MTGFDDTIEQSGAMTERETDLPHQEARAWLLKLRPGSASASDLTRFKRWLGESPHHARAFNETKQLWSELAPAARNVAARRAAVAQPIMPRRFVNRRVFLGGTMAAAASYAMISPPLGLWPSLPDVLASDYLTATGEQRRLSLADNVTLEMNTQTSIAVDGERRIELISGEGAIVTGAQDFEVIAADGRMRSRNAVFCIRHIASDVRVTCLEGVIEIALGDRVTSIGRRQQISYSGQDLDSVMSIDPEVVTAWRSGQLIFLDAPLSDVVAEANRYRRGKIIVANKALGRRMVTARFSLDRIEDVVPKLANAFGARATWLPAGVVILS